MDTSNVNAEEDLDLERRHSSVKAPTGADHRTTPGAGPARFGLLPSRGNSSSMQGAAISLAESGRTAPGAERTGRCARSRTN